MADALRSATRRNVQRLRESVAWRTTRRRERHRPARHIVAAGASAHARAEAVWAHSRPDTGLTWGIEVSGKAFVERADAYGAFGSGRTILEIGPGYGRLHAAAARAGTPYRSWLGVDVSSENVAHLERTVDDPRARWMCADARDVELEEPVDAVLSSLTFKHVYPSFVPVLRNLGPQMRAGGLLCFDVPEATLVDRVRRRTRSFVGSLYMRRYTREELIALLRDTGFALVAFDEVRHHDDYVRLLVVARRA